ncbi:pilus assembly protein PilY [Marinibactrum halimedae]|uniref:Pilus assembly protein PilY n=1 Tax=Marinibactrum halimedae TaxID=1444977 RepID=A0AA37T5V6_9GAMM|nr:pilus assembly protein PilY [Marinibactrum halimedae]
MTLSSDPLVVASAVPPNLMFLIDDSGSMTTIAPAAPFSEGTFSFDCPERFQIDPSLYIVTGGDEDNDQIFILTRTSPFSFNRNIFVWGTDLTRNSPYAVNKMCFDPNANYEASLQGFYGTYTGNYLNWYYSNSDQTSFDYFSGAGVKPEAKTRMEVAREAAIDIISGLDDIRVGVMSFNGGRGANVDVGLTDMTDSHRTRLINGVNSLSAGGTTPLAESLEGIGRYFIQGFQDNRLRLHPNNGAINSSDNYVSGSSIFNDTPSYWSPVLRQTQSTPTASDPIIQYSCQKNFIVSLTDGLPTSDNDVSTYLQGYDATSPITGDYPEDVALALYEMDLRPDLDNSDGSEEINNIKSYFIGFADQALLDSPLLPRAATNSGTTYITAEDASELQSALNSAISDIQEQIGTLGSVAFNSAELTTDSAVFLAQFNTARWSGNLFAYELSQTGEVSSTESWDASDKIDSQRPGSRNILTYNPESAEGVEFRWANLTASQKNDLGYDGSGSRDNSLGRDVLRYLRGNRTLEGNDAGDLRIRSSVLGDIVNSTPVYVGAPQLDYPSYSDDSRFGGSGDDYNSFRQGVAASRTPVLYFGANDGMLHGVVGNLTGSNAGQEVIAYIPSQLYDSSALDTGLHYLANQKYEHTFYVDLTPSISDVYIPRTTNGSEAWRTVLIGGLRAGGRGIFALDVTDPTEFSDETLADELVLWEFDSDDNNNLGYVYSPPTIAMMQNGRWAAILGNGYNNTGQGFADLFILYLDGGLDGVWTEGSDYLRISTESKATRVTNGLSTPRVIDIDGDMVADRIYAGDLDGNMWAFDVSSTNDNNWGVASSTSGGQSPLPLFTAKNDRDQRQPITAAPIVDFNTNVTTAETGPNANVPNVLVFFGTGRFIQPSDVNNYTDEQSFYAVWDRGAFELDRSTFAERTLVSSGGLRTVMEQPATDVNGNPVNDNILNWQTHNGWFVDLNMGGILEGERVVSDASIRGSVLFFNTIIPDTTACSDGGRGWLMSVDLLTGLSPQEGIFDVNNDGQFDYPYVGEAFYNGIPNQSGFLGGRQYTPGSDGTIQERQVNVFGDGRAGRLLWEERIPN